MASATSNILEQVALGKLNDVDFIECLSWCCAVVSVTALTALNRFVAENSLKQRLQVMRDNEQNLPSRSRRRRLPGMLHEGRMIEPRPGAETG